MSDAPLDQIASHLETGALDESFLRDESGAELLALAERKRAESRDVVEVPEAGEEVSEEEATDQIGPACSRCHAPTERVEDLAALAAFAEELARAGRRARRP